MSKRCKKCKEHHKREKAIVKDAHEAMIETLFWMGLDFDLTNPTIKEGDDGYEIKTPEDIVKALTAGLAKNKDDAHLQRAFAQWRIELRRWTVLCEDIDHHMKEDEN